jgi:hypothetical protein
VQKIFQKHGLELFDVDELSTHGGSLRIYARHPEDTSKTVTERVTALKDREIGAGLTNLDTYVTFSECARQAKRQLLEFLIAAKRDHKHIAGYGAPAKGNTPLNYCGIRQDFLDYTVDRSPKEGRFLPGTHIPVYGVAKLRDTKAHFRPHFTLDLKDEVMAQIAHSWWGGKFVVPIPRVEVLE